MSKVRNYFLTATGWRPVALAVVIVLVMFGLVFTASRAGAMPAPEHPSGFVRHFKAGDYGHTPRRVDYSKAFKRAWRHQYAKAWDRHNRTDCTDLPGGCASVTLPAWHGFNQRDSCGGNVGDDFSSIKCSLSPKQQHNIWALVASPYWTRRGEEQNRWEVRIIWCGGIGVASFFTGGTAAAAIGPGATGCLGSFFLG